MDISTMEVHGINIDYNVNTTFEYSSNKATELALDPALNIDQDYEDIGQILSRLNVSEHHFCLPLVSITCVCDNSHHKLHHLKIGNCSKNPTVLVSSSSDDTSNSDSDDNDSFKLVHLFRAFALYEKKCLEKKGASLGALRNLVNSYYAHEDIGEDETKQVIQLLEHEDWGLREMSLLTIRQLCVRENNTFKFLFHDIVPKLLLILELETTAALHEPAAITLEQVLRHTVLKDWWVHQMKMGGFASVLNHTSPEAPLPVRYACGCVLKSLAQVKEFAISIIDYAMDDVSNFKTMNSEFQELYTEIVSKLLLHADEVAASVLNIDALPASVTMLKQGPCGPQQQSLVLISTLSESSAGLQAIIENSVLPLIMSALVNTDCRKVRENAASTLAKITSNTKPEIQSQFLLQVDQFYHEQEDKLDVIMTEADETGHERKGKDEANQNKSLGKRERVERAVEDFSKDIVRLIQKEGKMEKDLQGDIVDVHLAPCIDINPHNLSTLCHLLSIIRNLVLYKVGQIKIILPQSEQLYPSQLKEIRSKKLPVNHKTVKTMLQVKILTLVDLLSVYTQKLLDIVSMKDKDIGMSSGQMLFQAWESQSTVMSKTGTVYLRSIFDEDEIKLIRSLLNTVEVISKCATSEIDPYDEESESLETKILHKIQSKDHSFDKKVTDQTQKKGSHKKKHTKFHSKASCELCNQKNHYQNDTKTSSLKATVLSASTTSNAKKQVDKGCDCKMEDIQKVETAYKEALQIELDSLARNIRIALFQSGVIESVGPWLLSADTTLQAIVLNILKNMIKPLQEKVVPSPPKEKKTKPYKIKSALEMNSKERDHAMSVALYQMSSRMRNFIEDALGKSESVPLNSPCDSQPHSPYIPQNYEKFARSDTPVSPSHSRPASGKIRRRLNENKLNIKQEKRDNVSSRRCRSAISRPSSAVTNHSKCVRSRIRECDVKKDGKCYVRPQSGNPSISNNDGFTFGVSTSPEGQNGSFTSTSKQSYYSQINSDKSRSSQSGHRCKSPNRPMREYSLTKGFGRVNSAPVVRGSCRKMWIPWKPQLNQFEPVGEQCRSLVAMVVGRVLLKQLFAKDQENRKKILNFIDEYIHHGQVSAHLKMSELGIIPKMIDFLRVNDDDQILEMMGLSVVQGLVKSDNRLKELFHKHGGTQLLMAMVPCSTGALKQEISDTLKVTTREPADKVVLRRRCKSAPLQRTSQVPDIWDKILDRWKQEDKVTTVLQKFT